MMTGTEKIKTAAVALTGALERIHEAAKEVHGVTQDAAELRAALDHEGPGVAVSTEALAVRVMIPPDVVMGYKLAQLHDAIAALGSAVQGAYAAHDTFAQLADLRASETGAPAPAPADVRA